MAKNVASGDDRVAVQVGRVGGGKDKDKPAEKRPAGDGDGTVKNIVTGNAKVGVQADVVGNVTIVGW
ncbi:hypothetical protein AB0C10_36635 [Microbispora amethystogenes]|uniref:hypothetical protein n=1 Tax=Microbispora amethystogenes TaxID=1427754 RepID=UPI0033D40B7C